MLRAVSGSASWARVKWVSRHPSGSSARDPSRIEEALRIEALFYARGERRQGCRLRLEHLYRRAHGLGRANERGVTALGADGAAHDRMIGVGAGWKSQPDETAGPVIECLGRRALRLDARDNGRPFGRRAGNLPDDGVGCRLERCHVAHLAPEDAAFERAQLFHPGARLSQQLAQRLQACLDGGRHAFDAKRRPARQVGGAGDFVRAAQRSAHGFHRRLVGQTQENQRARLVWGRQDLNRHLIQHGKRPPGAREQLGEIVAGDVLHHLAAGFEDLPASVDAAEAQQVIPRGAGGKPPRAREIAHHGADQCPLPGFLAEQWSEIRRFEGQHLVALRQQRLDVAHRRAGAQGHHQLLGCVVDDAADAGKVEHLVACHRPAERDLAAAAAHIERLAVVQSPFHRLSQFLRRPRLDCARHAQNRGISGKGSLL